MHLDGTKAKGVGFEAVTRHAPQASNLKRLSFSSTDALDWDNMTSDIIPAVRSVPSEHRDALFIPKINRKVGQGLLDALSQSHSL